MSGPDAVVIGAGPNGLAAAITIARAGRRVIVYEAADTIGGACRSGKITLPGFIHDLCSSVHPLAVASPAFREWPLHEYGLEWLEPAAMFAHPLDGGSAVLAYRDIAKTAHALGDDEHAYRQLFNRLVDDWLRVEADVLGPLRWPAHPVAMARFGLRALESVDALARRTFSGERARALLAGVAGHGMLPLDMPPSAGVALMLTLLAHTAGWSVPRGGAQSLSNALAAYLTSLGGEIVTGSKVANIDDLPAARAILCDLSPSGLLRVAGHRFSLSYRRALERFRRGPGVFKVDWALHAPIPWTNPACATAATVHLGGSFSDIAAGERAVWNGAHPERPYVLLTQPTVVDASRAPAGRHTAWAYCHVPTGSPVDMLERIERQVERFAPGFRERILARAGRAPADLERGNANLEGGDIAGGLMDLSQTFFRPTWRGHATPERGLYLCSASTRPGPGVHGMCGYLAATRALREVLQD